MASSAEISKGMKVIQTETGPNGELVELLYGEWKMGRTKLRKWHIYVDGVYADYGAIPSDADVNFARAVATGKGRV